MPSNGHMHQEILLVPTQTASHHLHSATPLLPAKERRSGSCSFTQPATFKEFNSALGGCHQNVSVLKRPRDSPGTHPGGSRQESSTLLQRLAGSGGPCPGSGRGTRGSRSFLRLSYRKAGGALHGPRSREVETRGGGTRLGSRTPRASPRKDKRLDPPHSLPPRRKAPAHSR